jgi:proteasome lid subunit RPN8/RPN11
MFSHFNEELEVAGLILKDGSIVVSPKEGSEDEVSFDQEFLDTYLADAAATWHTHPTEDANLSVLDWMSFVSRPELLHFIVSKDEIRGYSVNEYSKVLNTGTLLRTQWSHSTFMDRFGLMLT